MARVSIDPGICGFPTTVEIKKIGKRQFSVILTTECEKLSQLASQIETLDLVDGFKQAKDSRLYNAVADCQLHPACPAPVGIIKALEVEAGIALAHDIIIHFDT
jgi:sorbitol-specific phosphotransferase system component IIBC